MVIESNGLDITSDYVYCNQSTVKLELGCRIQEQRSTSAYSHVLGEVIDQGSADKR